MNTGGFRTKLGIEDALKSGSCDLVGIAWPAAVIPQLPRKIILNEVILDEDAHVTLTPLSVPFFIRHSSIVIRLLNKLVLDLRVCITRHRYNGWPRD